LATIDVFKVDLLHTVSVSVTQYTTCSNWLRLGLRLASFSYTVYSMLGLVGIVTAAGKKDLLQIIT
jgi:hypothetical protein